MFRQYYGHRQYDCCCENEKKNILVQSLICVLIILMVGLIMTEKLSKHVAMVQYEELISTLIKVLLTVWSRI
jgi:hypothetical protein